MTIAKGGGSASHSPTSSSSSSSSGSTVITKNIPGKNAVICRSGSLSSNCSHVVQCKSESSEKISGTNDFPGLRPCRKHSSYDDLLSATTSNSGSSTYGFNVRRPVLKRSCSSLSRKKHSGYSTNSLCSNKSVKFNLPIEAETGSEIMTRTTEKKFTYFFRTNHNNNNPDYIFYGNYCCANCGMCNHQFWYQNFFNYQLQQAQLLQDSGFYPFPDFRIFFRISIS